MRENQRTGGVLGPLLVTKRFQQYEAILVVFLVVSCSFGRFELSGFELRCLDSMLRFGPRLWVPSKRGELSFILKSLKTGNQQVLVSGALPAGSRRWKPAGYNDHHSTCPKGGDYWWSMGTTSRAPTSEKQKHVQIVGKQHDLLPQEDMHN